jgi:hypothetical protein
MVRPLFSFQRLGMILALAVAGCGGGGGGGGSSGSSSSAPAPSSTPNQVPMVVQQFQSIQGYATINEPYVTVTVCDASSHCQNIDHVVVDTGSYGLRIPASVLTLTLPQVTAPAGSVYPGSPVGECASFLDGYMWGSVRTATIKISGEVAANIPIQVTDDPNMATAPGACSGSGIDVGNLYGIGGNGILGIGLFNQDGQTYFSCSGNSCVDITNYMPSSLQVSNPVASFAQDNNGVVLQMPSIPASGQATATGTLTFGLDTQTNNSLAGYSVLQADGSGYITAVLNNQTYSQSFIDSGSNFYFLNLSGISTGSFGGSIYYTPSTTLTYQAVLQGNVGSASLTAPVSVANAMILTSPVNAYNDIAGTGVAGSADLGLTFFYGRSVAFAISGSRQVRAAAPFYGIH